MMEAFDLLFFTMRGRRCATNVSAVREVVANPLVTPVPLAPAHVRGAMSFHGLPVIVLDLGVDLLAGSLDSSGPHGENVARGNLEYALVVEANLPDNGTFVQAALLVEKVMRIVTVPSNLFRPHSGQPSFISATVADSEGPALLVDIAVALGSTMKNIRHGRQAA
jgi:chemotaxis signal transduction protein